MTRLDINYFSADETRSLTLISCILKVVRGKKGMRPPTHIEELHSDRRIECRTVPGCSNQLLTEKHESCQK